MPMRKDITDATQPVEAAEPGGTIDLPVHVDPSVNGIMRCLTLLVDEATSLNLAATREMLCCAMEVCDAEIRRMHRPASDRDATRNDTLH